MSRAVIDQPGFRIAIGGLIVSFVLGFILKAQIAPSRVQKHLEKAVSRLEQDFRIDFEEAHVNLSNWGLPWPRLEINRVRLSPKKNSCQSSQIFIDQIEVPISWSSFLDATVVVDTVRAHHVELRLADLENCIESDRKVDKKAQTQPAQMAVAVSPVNPTSTIKSSDDSLFQRRTSSQLKTIHIEQLRVIVKNHYQQPLVFRQLSFGLEYSRQNLSKIHIKSRLLALNDPKSNVFYLVAELDGFVKALEQNEFETHFNLKGRMLDGDLQILAQFNSLAQKISYELMAKKVSVKAFLPLLNLGASEAVFEKWPLNLSFDLAGETSLISSAPLSQIKVKEVEFFGEKTSVAFSSIDLEVKNNLIKAKPFQVDIERLPLNTLKNLASIKNDLGSFEDLGILKAKVYFSDEKNWKMDGLLQNIYLIFSNRGTRELQKIDSIQFQSTQKNNQNDLVVSEIKINNEKIEGGLEAHYNQDSHNMTAQMDVAGVFLNPKIWKQLTQVEQAAEVKMNWTYRKTSDIRQQILLTVPKIDFEGYQINGTQIDLIQAQTEGEDHQSIAMSLKAQEVLVRVPELQNATAQGLFNETSGLMGKQYRASRLHLNLRGTDWKTMVFDFDMGLNNIENEKEQALFKGKGSWKDDDIISATATLQNGIRLIKYDINKTAQNEILLTPVK